VFHGKSKIFKNHLTHGLSLRGNLQHAGNHACEHPLGYKLARAHVVWRQNAAGLHGQRARSRKNIKKKGNSTQEKQQSPSSKVQRDETLTSLLRAQIILKINHLHRIHMKR
jgi:hypothetical protein